MVDTTTLDRLDAAYESGMRQRRRREIKRLRPPVATLWHARTVGLDLAGRIAGEYTGDCEWVVNDVGRATISMPEADPLARWAAEWYNRDKDVVVLRIDKDGERWCGTLSDLDVEQHEQGDRTVHLTFLHDWEQFKHIPVYPNPMFPSAFQAPKVFQLFMKAMSLLALTLQLNLLRHFTVLGGHLPDDPLKFESWQAAWNWRDWPILVAPINYLEDPTPLRYLGARMDYFADLAQPILEDVQLHMRIDRWFEGDPDPWPGARLTRNGQMIVTFHDKSGWFGETATEGTLGRGLTRTALEIADGGVEEIRNLVDARPDTPQYHVSRWLGVAPGDPYVVYRTSGAASMVRSARASYSPPTVGMITVGGQSMPGVNETMSAVTKVVFNLLGAAIPGGAGFGAIVDDAAKPIYENTTLAFQTLDLVLRTRRLGWGHYLEDTDVGNIEAFTVASVVALRALRRATDAKSGHTLDVGDGAPFLIGARGEGHWHYGDRIGHESLLSRDGRIETGQANRVALAWAADEPHHYAVTIGEFPRRDPVEWAIKLAGSVAKDLQRQGLM